MKLPTEHKNNTERNKNMSTTNKQQLLAAVSARNAGRSAWTRGVKAYAVELVEGLNDGADLCNEVMLQKELLNGAQSWAQYAEGGCALCYNADIDVQARALWQSHKVVETEWRKLERGEA